GPDDDGLSSPFPHLPGHLRRVDPSFHQERNGHPPGNPFDQLPVGHVPVDGLRGVTAEGGCDQVCPELSGPFGLLQGGDVSHHREPKLPVNAVDEPFQGLPFGTGTCRGIDGDDVCPCFGYGPGFLEGRRDVYIITDVDLLVDTDNRDGNPFANGSDVAWQIGPNRRGTAFFRGSSQ